MTEAFKVFFLHVGSQELKKQPVARSQNAGAGSIPSDGRTLAEHVKHGITLLDRQRSYLPVYNDCVGIVSFKVVPGRL